MRLLLTDDDGTVIGDWSMAFDSFRIAATASSVNFGEPGVRPVSLARSER